MEIASPTVETRRPVTHAARRRARKSRHRIPQAQAITRVRVPAGSRTVTARPTAEDMGRPERLPRHARLVLMRGVNKTGKVNPKHISRRYWDCRKCGWDADTEIVWTWWNALHHEQRSALMVMSRRINDLERKLRGKGDPDYSGATRRF